MKTLGVLDYIVIVIYFLIIGTIGVRMSRGEKTADKYFTANRRIPWWAMAFTLLAAMISTGTIIGVPGTVYQKGMILLLGHLMLPVVLIFVAIIIVPFYRRVVRMSAYEYINQRFGGFARVFASLGFLLDRVFDMGVTMTTTGIAISVMTGWDMMTVTICLGLFTIFYTMFGGIEAVVWTDTVQGIIMISSIFMIGAALLFSSKAGPPFAVVRAAWDAGKFNLGSFDWSWKSLFDTQNKTQWLIIFAYSINWGRRYICDQHMVQRYLLAKSDSEARRGTLWGAIACVPIWMSFMFFGACLFGYYQLTHEKPPAMADEILPYFVMNALPVGVIGLILSAIMAASMSNISVDLNSMATVITSDYYMPLRPRATDGAKVAFGRFMVLATGIAATAAGIALLPRQGSAPLMERGVTIGAIIAGGGLGLFCLGFLTRRATRQGCYVGIVACLIFSAWGILTQDTGGGKRAVDMGLNFTMNPILIGVFSHAILFGVGYVASLVLGGYRPENVEQLTIYRLKDVKEEAA